MAAEIIHARINDALIEIDPAVIAKYDRPGPRYTSYPTAPQWRDQVTTTQYRQILQQSNRHARPVSLYFHLPFCVEHCTFCGCNVIVTKQRAVTQPYLFHLQKELELLAADVDRSRNVVQLHFGGGTPTYFSSEQLETLWGTITQHFTFAPDAEIGIEADPRITTVDQLRTLKRLGFNRLSMGAQDFDPQVQQAINRNQTYEQTAQTINAARELGFTSINVDLIYGLPYQSAESFAETVQTLIGLNPDRVACYNFAFVPWLKAQQRKIDPATLPDPSTKLRIWTHTMTQFAEAGYEMIGFDHFAKPDDELSLARRNGTLWRNFQGYTTKRGTDLLACGITGIGDVDGHYLQNVKKLPSYYRAIDEGQFPIERGCTLSRDDQIRRHVIRELLCNNQLSFASVNAEWQIDFAEYFVEAIPALRELETGGLLHLTATQLTITPFGRLFARNIAMCFDAYLSHDAASQQKYSRTV